MIFYRPNISLALFDLDWKHSDWPLRKAIRYYFSLSHSSHRLNTLICSMVPELSFISTLFLLPKSFSALLSLPQIKLLFRCKCFLFKSFLLNCIKKPFHYSVKLFMSKIIEYALTDGRANHHNRITYESVLPDRRPDELTEKSSLRIILVFSGLLRKNNIIFMFY